MGKRMQERTLKAVGIWKGKGKRSESAKWLHGDRKELKKWLG